MNRPRPLAEGAKSCREDQRSAARMIVTALTANPTMTGQLASWAVPRDLR